MLAIAVTFVTFARVKLDTKHAILPGRLLVESFHSFLDRSPEPFTGGQLHGSQFILRAGEREANVIHFLSEVCTLRKAGIFRAAHYIPLVIPTSEQTSLM
jgi:hypothetical protein